MAANDLRDSLHFFRVNEPEAALKFFKDKMTFTTGPVEVNAALTKKAEIVIVDVRDKADFDKGHIPGAVSLPKTEWQTFQGLSENKLNIVYCYSQVCHLAAKACVYFANEGYSVMELEGGYKGWEAHKLPVEGVNKEAA
jgi:rhodanese-related sulfurtransferase